MKGIKNTDLWNDKSLSVKGDIMVIETERLLLRPFLEGDAADVFEYLKEPMVNCFACMKLESLEEARAEMKNRIGETEYYFAIVLKETGKVIGKIDAYPEHAEPHDQEGDSPLDTFSPCWMLNKTYHGEDVYMPIRRIIIFRASAFAKSLVCAGKVCLWNLYPLSIILTVHRAMKIHISMLF